jgi:hypothetical protein
MLLENDTPENTGISSAAILELLGEFEQRDTQITSFVLLKDGRCICRFCRPPYEIDTIQLWFSVTKSFTGIGVGIACDKGLLRLDDSVIGFYPDKLPDEISENLRAMRVKHLLSMSCGIHENTYADLYPQPDWAKAFLAQDFPHEPGTFYRYSTHASHMLAAIVERVTGRSFYDFLRENLFTPLGIRESTWETCAQGITAGGMGLGLTVDSVAKFAQMLLDGGVYDGKRIVSEEYIRAATTEQSDNRSLEKDRHKNGYGYHIRIDHDGSFFHPGAFGQLWYACPRKKIALALTSRGTKIDDIIDLLQSKIMENASGAALPASNSYGQLRDRLKSLCYPTPVFKPIPAGVPVLDPVQYRMDSCPHGLLSVSFSQGASDRLDMRLTYADRADSLLRFSFTGPVTGRGLFVKDIQFHEQKYVSYAAWESKETLLLTIFYIETPYEVTYRIQFDNEGIRLAFHMNVSLNLKDFECRGWKV